ncbi:MAG: protocatechuate 3,4-dioxygenase subunit alpha [Rubrobacter sp.]|nr:protocatechuate 3,4-dioxygenase subunit alpha [Rubrobacter sp.]
MTLEPTPSQTVGPFFHDALLAADWTRLMDPDHPSAVHISGTVCDGEGEPVPDAMLEIWQADPEGRFARSGDEFSGFGRCGTDAEGRFEFVTVKPGPVLGPDGGSQAPHIAVSVFARGLLKRLVTRIYFPEEEAANADDPVLASVEDPDLRDTLVARARDGGYVFDVHLQGQRQTVFFDV